jgi:hypothetical protein
MNIPKYWAKRQASIDATRANGQALLLSCWQWSNSSTSEAFQRADARLNELVQKAAMGMRLNRYSYGERAMREETTQSITNDDGREVAVVTRNAYGALVLNAANAMFIDIDFPENEKSTAPTSGVGRLSLFGGKSKPAAPTLSLEERGLQRVTAWAAQHPDLGLRVYRTFGGLRCLVTNTVFEPGSSDALGILKALDSDPLYVSLCRQQQCFRARLTPKYWRCGVKRPPSRFPWDNPGEEARYRQWQQGYEMTSSSFATCRLVKAIGSNQVHPDIAPILNLHDQLACTDPRRALA